MRGEGDRDEAYDDPYRRRTHEAECQRTGGYTDHRGGDEDSQFRPQPSGQQYGGCLQWRHDQSHEWHGEHPESSAKATLRDTEQQHGRNGSHVEPGVCDQGLLLPADLPAPGIHALIGTGGQS
jgi:hypothetical protein